MTTAQSLVIRVPDPAPSRLPVSLKDDAHARKILEAVFGSPDIIEKDAMGTDVERAKLLGGLFDALTTSTSMVEGILVAAAARRAITELAGCKGAERGGSANGSLTQVSVEEYRWAHVMRMLALLKSGASVVPPNYNVTIMGDLDHASLRQLEIGAVDRLMYWNEANANGGGPVPGPICSMVAALMDAFLYAGYLEHNSPGITALSISDRPSTLHQAIHIGNVGLAQSLLDFGVDLRRLPTRDIEFVRKGHPSCKVVQGDVATLLDFCAIEQPHTVALARDVLMRQQILGAREGAQAAAQASMAQSPSTVPIARGVSRKGL